MGPETTCLLRSVQCIMRDQFIRPYMVPRHVVDRVCCCPPNGAIGAVPMGATRAATNEKGSLQSEEGRWFRIAACPFHVLPPS